jgi:hypothetical protein
MQAAAATANAPPRQPALETSTATRPTAASPPAGGGNVAGDGSGASSFAAYLSALALAGISLHLLASALARTSRRPAPAYAPPVPPA